MPKELLVAERASRRRYQIVPTEDMCQRHPGFHKRQALPHAHARTLPAATVGTLKLVARFWQVLTSMLSEVCPHTLGRS